MTGPQSIKHPRANQDGLKKAFATQSGVSRAADSGTSDEWDTLLLEQKHPAGVLGLGVPNSLGVV